MRGSGGYGGEVGGGRRGRVGGGEVRVDGGEVGWMEER